jgi:cell shape-determining protein MreC
MRFLQQNKFQNSLKARPRKRLLKTGIIISALVLIVIIFNYFTFGGVSQILHTVGIPIWKSQAGVLSAFENLFVGLKDKQSLLTENKKLKDEAVRLKLVSIGAEILRKENEDLRMFLNRDISRELIAASILTRPNRTLYDTFIVDVGRVNGVTQGSYVFGVEEVAIGSVEEVYAHTSLISLYSTPGRKTEVLLGSELVSAKAVGRGGGDFELRIPRGIEVLEGHAVYSPNLDGGIFGVIEKVIALPADSFQTVLFSSPVNIQTLHVVAIQLQ